MKAKQDFNNSAKYHLALVNAAKTPEQKQKEIGKLKDTLAKNNFVAAGLEYKVGGKQEDASEFLVPLFDELYEEAPLTETSQIILLEKADQYKSKPKKSDPKKTIELEIVGGNSMSHLLDSFQKEEKLTEFDKKGNSNLPKYVKGSGVEESKESGVDHLKSSKKLSLSVTKGATEIALSVKRFKQDDYGNRTKIHDAIKLDNITLPKTEDNGKKVKFEPTAFIVHSGEFGSGHYLAYVKEKDKKGNVSWYEYDDRNVRKISEHETCIPRTVVGTNVSLAMGLNPEASISFLELRKQQAYMIKYSAQNERGEVILPQRDDNERVGAINLGNTCWANSAAAFIGSFTSFTKEKLKERDEGQEKEKEEKNSKPSLYRKENSADITPSFKENFKKQISGKRVSFASENDIEEFDKLDPIIPDRKLFKYKNPEIPKLQDIEINNLHQNIQKDEPKPIKAEVKISEKNFDIKNKASEEIKFKENKLILPTTKESKVFSNVDQIEEKLEKYGNKIDSKTKELIERAQNQKDNVFANKFIRALNNLRKIPKDSNSEEVWKNLTTLDRRVLVDYYNKNHNSEIDFKSLYKEADVGQKAELRINSQGYVLDSTKINDLKKIINYAAEAIPKSSVENSVAKKLVENSRVRDYSISQNN